MKATRSQAFSLIELVVVMGVVCIALLPLLGLMSMGTMQLSETYQSSVANKIFSQVETKVANVAIATVLEKQGSVFYFDKQGIAVDRVTEALYQAQYQVLPLDMPGGQGGSLKKVKRVHITVEYIPNGRPVPDKTQSKFVYVSNP